MKKNIIVIVLSLFIFLLASFIYNFIKEQNLTEETKLSEKEVIALFKNYKPLSGLNVFLIWIEIDLYKAGIIVGGNITFAPA